MFATEQTINDSFHLVLTIRSHVVRPLLSLKAALSRVISLFSISI